MKLLPLLAASAALSCVAVPAAAQSLAIVNARIVTMGPAGSLRSGTVLVENGKIAAIGVDIPIPPATRVVDAEGQFLTPGLVETVTPLALADTIGTGDGGRSASGPLTAAFSVADDVNPNNPQIGEARIEGVTRAVLAPNAQVQGKLFGGQVAVMHLGAGMDLVTDRTAAIYLNAGEGGAEAAGGGRGAIRERLASAIRLARAFRAKAVSFDAAEAAREGLSLADLKALLPVADGREPLLVEVNRASDILVILSTAKELGIKVILSGGAEAWLVADRIAASGTPVVIDGEENQPDDFDKLNASYENARRLQDAGVLVALKPSIARIAVLIRTPRFIAGRTVRYGLSWHDALAAITINPARMFGFADRTGSIEVGKDADLVLWSGDPLETTSVARMVVIRGEEQSLTSRNRALRDRYLPTLSAP